MANFRPILEMNANDCEKAPMPSLICYHARLVEVKDVSADCQRTTTAREPCGSLAEPGDCPGVPEKPAYGLRSRGWKARDAA